MNERLVLKLLKIPHFVEKVSTEFLNSEVFAEFYSFFGYILETSAKISLIFRNNTLDRNEIEVFFVIEFNHTVSNKIVSQLANLKNWKFKETKINTLTDNSTNNLKLGRKINFIPVGDLTNLYGEIPFMPLLNKLEKKWIYKIPLLPQIDFLSLQTGSKFKNILETLISQKGDLKINIQPYVCDNFDTMYSSMCLQMYFMTYANELPYEKLIPNVLLYQEIIAGEDVFSVEIIISGNIQEQVEFALKKDLDFKNIVTETNILNFGKNFSSIEKDVINFLKNVKNLWTKEETLQLLIPPYTYTDSLSGLEHFVPKPFIIPFIKEKNQEETYRIIIGKSSNKEITIDTKELTKHLFVTGITGSGKTNTIMYILNQLYEKNINFLIIDPVKTEYEDFMKYIKKPNMIIDFKENIYPFNPFIPPDNISLYTHTIVLAKSLSIFMPTNEIASVYILNIIRDYYLRVLNIKMNMMWKIKGKEINLKDNCIKSNLNFKKFFSYSKKWWEIKYERQKKSTFIIEAAEHFERRWDIFRKSIIYEILSGNDPIYTLFEHSLLIELYTLIDDNEKNLLFSLLLNLLYEHRLSQGLFLDRLKHVTVIEEAHRILPSVTEIVSDKDVISNPILESSKLISNALSEMRAFGEGFFIIDQSPSKLNKDTIINTASKIIHKVVYGPDQLTVQQSIGLSEKEMNYLLFLFTGEAIISIPSVNQPLYCEYPHFKIKKGI